MNLVKSFLLSIGYYTLGYGTKKILYHNDKGFLKIK